MFSLRHPTIHSNGSGRELLLDNLGSAINELIVARAALLKTAPHGRDYYVQKDGADAVCDANNRFRPMVKALDDMIAALEAQALSIIDPR